MHDKLFVYGTLLSRFKHPMHDTLSVYCDFFNTATVQGKLYEIDGYPGLTLSDDQNASTLGEIYSIKTNKQKQLFSILDEYEMCSADFPEPQEYTRTNCSAKLKEGQTISTWVYLYAYPTDNLIYIENGDYFAFRSSSST